ncbi:MAG: lipoprotein signal peptidase [Alloprevotella sp.]|nr:lipoprotein signal peptidase [Alloprevotella sp.]
MKKRSLIALAIFMAVIIIDQIIKIVVKTNMSLYEQIDVTSWCKILFVENRGMAFGMSFIGTSILSAFRIVAVVAFVYLLAVLCRRKYPIGLVACVALVVAGALGNIIDNCFYGLCFSESLPYNLPAEFVGWGNGYSHFLSGKVVDMFYFPFFTWPDWMPLVGGDVFFGAVFNFADAAISCGAVAILLFYNKYLTGKDKKAETDKAAAPTNAEANIPADDNKSTNP